MAKRLQDLVEFGLENPDLERRRVVAEALLARRQKQMLPHDGGIFIDTSLVTCAEYQLFIDDQQAIRRSL